MDAIVITGAAKGIGRATALLLDRQGFMVFAGVRSQADGDQLRKEASSNLHPIVLDVTNASQIAQAVETVHQTLGTQGLAGLINNAGIAVAAPLEHLPIDEFRRQIEVNLIGQLAVTQAFLPLIRQAKGRIVNISSVGGRIAGATLGAYHASKFALEAMTDTLRQELAPWGIQVISIEPGAVATPIWESGTSTADRLFEQMPPQGRSNYEKAIARTRAFGEKAAKTGLPPERVAQVIERALTEKRPRTRYAVGIDAQIGTRLLAKLPDRIRDRFMRS